MYTIPEILMNSELEYRRERAQGGRRGGYRAVKPRRARRLRRSFVPEQRRGDALEG